ncbi:hypothetical protein [Paenibacillus sp. BC26]|uniref:hypothetical protein n=1 Tax=Paenibacillus sp. BC26 TaxID=1881032 RepID=UPI0011606E76|nr:hypothetical protein [Paenibacillus sp. BC26]
MAKIYRLFAQTLSEMSDEEFHDLLEGKGKLKFVPGNKAVKEKVEKVSSAEVGYIVEKLLIADTREMAREYLVEQHLSKNDLIKLTVVLDIFVNKSDGKDKIMEKIVESTVGARIRSKAIKDTQIRTGPARKNNNIKV